MARKTIYIIILTSLLIFSCSKDGAFQLQEGDFVFQDLDCGPLCDAIEEVTTGLHGARLSHVGLVVRHNDSLKIVEAIGEGVVLTKPKDFLRRSSDIHGKPKVIVMRLKDEHLHVMKDALDNYAGYIDKPYDGVYYMHSLDSLYCSEMLYRLFYDDVAQEYIFSLQPMTFKSPSTGNFYPAWVEYYDALGITIPEGLPGINPGSMSRSPALELVHYFGLPDGFSPQKF